MKRLYGLIVVLVFAFWLALSAQEVVVKIPEKLITMDDMLIHVITRGPTDFEHDGWTVKFEKLQQQVAPKIEPNASEASRHVSTVYKAAMSQGSTTIRYFIYIARGYDDEYGSLENSVSVRVPLSEFDQFIEKKPINPDEKKKKRKSKDG